MKNIYFVTRRTDHVTTLPLLSLAEAKLLLFNNASKLIGLDFETTGLDAKKEKLLLTAITNFEDTFIIDNTSIPLVEFITTQDLFDRTVIAHNAKFEWKYSFMNGVYLKDVHCTQVIDQRLYLGAGLHFNLLATLERHNIEVATESDKTIRNDFIGATMDIVFTDKHLKYAAFDVIPLKKLYEIQMKIAKQQDLLQIVAIENRLVRIVANFELEGTKFDSTAWTKIAVEKIRKLGLLATALNTEIAHVDLIEVVPAFKKSLDTKENKLQVLEDRIVKNRTLKTNLERANKTTLKSYEKICAILEKAIEEKVVLEQREIESQLNWSSSKQVIALLHYLGMPVPKQRDKATYKMKESVGEPARLNWLLNNKGLPRYSLMENYHKYRELLHTVTSFGLPWIANYVEDNRVYTQFKQCSTTTGRFSSGNAKEGKYNSQQIPAEKQYRHCFLADPGYEIVTCDLSGAELVIMASLSNDTELYKLGAIEDDLHSPMAQACWRAIYKNRYLLSRKAKYDVLAKNFIVSKTENKVFRTKFKAMTFGAVYGMEAGRAASTLDITYEEAQIVLDTIRKRIPKVFEMVEKASEVVFLQGFVKHNDVTNTKRWFTPVVKALHTIDNRVDCTKANIISFTKNTVGKFGGSTHSIAKQARNSAIQGTQSDMVKEAIVLQFEYNLHKQYPVQFRGTVHDECIWQFPKDFKATCPYTGEEVSYGELTSRIMTRTANKYLREGMEMTAEYDVLPYWTK